MDNAVLVHHGIKGMRWGVRRYQNRDGTLTPRGQKRYDRDRRENAAKKKDNRIDVSNPDPKRWAREDLERSKKIVDSSSDFVKQVRLIEQSTRPKKDLSAMSDKEMRDQINRKLLEQQYEKLFSSEQPSNLSKGRKYLDSTLEVVGTVLTVTGSALSIAKAIKDLKG